jgi:hypothetical protein
MNNLHLHTLTATLAALAFGASAGLAQANFADTVVPPVPSNIQVPAGNKLYLKAHAVGTQNYICRATTTGYGWVLFGPQATLFLTFKWFSGEIRQQVMTHFLSQNPDEGGTARPTWQSSTDTSTIWGRAAASSTDPNYVAPNSVAWLLVEVVGRQEGPTGGDFLGQTTFVHRLSTLGGVAPATGCTQQSNVGDAILVPYETDYFFYKAVR